MELYFEQISSGICVPKPTEFAGFPYPQTEEEETENAEQLPVHTYTVLGLARKISVGFGTLKAVRPVRV